MHKKRTILVTGGNGFVGGPLSFKLASQGYDVISISRATYNSDQYRSLVADISDPVSLAAALDPIQIDAVVHLASLLNTASRSDPGAAVRVNVNGSLFLLEYCITRGIPRFIYGSSYNAIGTCDASAHPVKETDPASPSEFYGETKRFVEMMGIAMAEEYGIEFAAGRMSVVVGPGEPSPSSAFRMDIFNKLRTGGEIDLQFREDEILPMAHYEDIAEELSLLALNDQLEFKIYNLPSCSIRTGDLAILLKNLRPDLKVQCGERRINGIPRFVSADRFINEFGYQPRDIMDQLEDYQTGAK
jgi:nucleoside-diphosphate-sugar epimerase